jgi:hypothetical protein
VAGIEHIRQAVTKHGFYTKAAVVAGLVVFSAIPCAHGKIYASPC